MPAPYQCYWLSCHPCWGWRFCVRACVSILALWGSLPCKHGTAAIPRFAWQASCMRKRTVQTQHNSFSKHSEKVCLHALIKQWFDMFLLFWLPLNFGSVINFASLPTKTCAALKQFMSFILMWQSLAPSSRGILWVLMPRVEWNGSCHNVMGDEPGMLELWHFFDVPF